MKGIILAGGSGSRLWPLTASVSKQLLPVYDKPMIYYPLATLMESSIKDILIITNRTQVSSFIELLGNGSRLGISIKYEIQDKPNGIAEAFIVGDNFLRSSNDEDVALILGDNLFISSNLKSFMYLDKKEKLGLFLARVNDPSRYGVPVIHSNSISSIEEKPENPTTNFVVTGLYLYKIKSVLENVKKLTPSKRGELEITDLNNLLLNESLYDKGNYFILDPNSDFWADMGTPESLLQASNHIEATQNRTGSKIACIEEIAYNKKWIDNHTIYNSEYGNYLEKVMK